MGRRLALLIATGEYEDTGLCRLTSPAHDAAALATVLSDPRIAGFEVTTLVNEPHHRVGQAIGDLYRDRRRDDLTLLYFSGHGLKDDVGRLYLAMTNTLRTNLLFTGLPAEQVDQAMEHCASQQKVLVLDCCYSGAFPTGRIAKGDLAVHALERFQGRGRTVLTASDAAQYSFEGGEPHGQSVFTRHLVAGLRDGSADLDGDGDVTLDELYSYVHDRVVEEVPQQRPKRQDNVEGRIVVARNVNWMLPPYLHNALSSPIATDRLAALDGLTRLHRMGNDTVRARVREEIHRLTDDDSKLVSTAATTLLRSVPSEVPAGPAALPRPAASPGPAAMTGPETLAAPATPAGQTSASRKPAPAVMTEPPPATFRWSADVIRQPTNVLTVGRFLGALFTVRTWAEQLYVIVSMMLGMAGLFYLLLTLGRASTNEVTNAHRRLANRLLGETIAASAPQRGRAHLYLLMQSLLAFATFLFQYLSWAGAGMLATNPIWNPGDDVWQHVALMTLGVVLLVLIPWAVRVALVPHRLLLRRLLATSA